MSLHRSIDPLAGEQGYTLIELVIGMAIGLVVSLAAFGLIEFVTADVSRITERTHVSQLGRTTLENVILKLHSSCVAVGIAPIRATSSATSLRFISENGEGASLSSVKLRELLYSSAEGTLVEKTWPSTGGIPPKYTFNEGAKPATKLLLTNVSQTVVEKEGKKETVPMFRYYRYYNAEDAHPEYGELDPEAMMVPLSEATAKLAAKITIAFTVSPEGKEAATFNHDRPIAFEDSAVLRLAPSSSSSAITNLPCAELQ